MRAFTALVAREISERKALLVAAAVASLLPLLAPLLPGTGSNSAADIREAVMWVMVMSLVPIFALLLGVSFIGRDLAENRFGFYYAQPISGSAIWFGKLTAVVLLMWAVQLIVVLPTMIISPDPTTILFGKPLVDVLTEDWMATVVFWGASMAIILLAHAVGIVWRARSVWIVADLVALVVIAVGAWAAFEPFGFMVAPRISWWILGSVFTALFIGLVLGGAIQVISGRVDLCRCHRVLTTALWSVIGVTVAALLGWTWWIRSATIEDLDWFNHAKLGSGEWIATTGVFDGRLDYCPRFLLNVTDGRNLRLGPAVNWNRSQLEFSEDGSRALWIEYEGINHWSVMFADLNGGRPSAEFAGLVLSAEWEDFAVSPNGDRMAVVEDRMIAVSETATGQQLMAVSIDGEFNPSAVLFKDESTVRFLGWSKAVDDNGFRKYAIGTIDVENRAVGEMVEIDTWWRWWSRALGGPLGRRLVVVDHPDGERLVLTSPDSAEIVADLGEAPYWTKVRITPDRRIVILRDRNKLGERDTENRLEVFSAEGVLLHSINIPLAGAMTVAGRMSGDRLVIGLRDWREARERGGPDYSTAIIDLSAGVVEQTMEDVSPVLGRWGSSSTAGAWAVDSFAGRLFRDEAASLLLWHPESESFETIIPVSK